MRIGLVTDGLPDLALPELLRTAAELGIATLEFGCGNWSSAPHLKIDALLASNRGRDDFLAALAAYGLSISALNCSGNPLHPGEHGRAHREVTSKTIRLAGLLGVARVVLMSGCPGGPGELDHHGLAARGRARAGVAMVRAGDSVLARAGAGSASRRRGAALPGVARPAERFQRGDFVPAA